MEGSVNDFTRRKTVHIQGFHFFVALPFNFTLSGPQLPFKFFLNSYKLSSGKIQSWFETSLFIERKKASRTAFR